jgi:hypothetical protein
MVPPPSSPAVTPFIPPLSTPEGLSSQMPPVIPPSAGGTPSWGPQNQIPGYPMYPPTPYNNVSPFIPQMSVHGTPGNPPGSYFPPPVSLPPVGPPPAAQGLSGDYTGYPQFGPPVQQGWGPPPTMYPTTPGWPMAQPWGPSPGGYPQFTPHFGAQPPMPMPPVAPHMGMGMGGPGAPWGPQPGFGGMWGTTPAWPGMGGAPLPPDMQQGQHGRQHRGEGMDKINPFATGKSCMFSIFLTLLQTCIFNIKISCVSRWPCPSTIPRKSRQSRSAHTPPLIPTRRHRSRPSQMEHALFICTLPSIDRSSSQILVRRTKGSRYVSPRDSTTNHIRDIPMADQH